jgi:hypothetical protein
MLKSTGNRRRETFLLFVFELFFDFGHSTFRQAPKANHKGLEDRKEVSLGGLCGSNSSLPDSSGVLLGSRLNSYKILPHTGQTP